MFIRRLNTAADHSCNWDGAIFYSEFKNVLRSKTSSATEIYCFGTHDS
jgi:hypothetical protein